MCRVLGLLLAVTALTAACSLGSEDATDGSSSPAASATADPARFVQNCSDLMSELEANVLVQTLRPGGSSAEYQAPNRGEDLLSGVVCRQGILAREAVLTVSIRSYGNQASARAYQRRSLSSTSAGQDAADSVNILGVPGSVVASPTETTCYVREAGRVVQVTLRNGSVSAGGTREDLVSITESVIQALPAL